MNRILAALGEGDPAAAAWHERMSTVHPAAYHAWRTAVETPNRVVFVLGMHRSGTSCLMACLEQCGVHVGQVERFSRGQPGGNLERASALRVNERMLVAAGGSWSDPPAELGAVGAEQDPAIAEVLADLQAHAPGGLKDPRLVFTLDAWLAATDSPVLVGTFRHPDAVAASLHEREGMAADDARALWRRYNGRLVALHRRHGFPLVEFDPGDAAGYCDRVVALAATIGLAPRPAALRAVVEDDGGGPTAVAPGAPVPDDCAEIYTYLRRHRHTGVASPGSFAAALAERAELAGPAVRRSPGEELARRVWRTTRRLPRPVRGALRPVHRAVFGVIRKRSAADSDATSTGRVEP